MTNCAFVHWMNRMVLSTRKTPPSPRTGNGCLSSHPSPSSTGAASGSPAPISIPVVPLADDRLTAGHATFPCDAHETSPMVIQPPVTAQPTITIAPSISNCVKLDLDPGDRGHQNRRPWRSLVLFYERRSLLERCLCLALLLAVAVILILAVVIGLRGKSFSSTSSVKPENYFPTHSNSYYIQNEGRE